MKRLWCMLTKHKWKFHGYCYVCNHCGLTKDTYRGDFSTYM